MKSHLVLGLYLPIAVMALLAALLLLTKLVWPLMTRQPDEVRENLIGIGATGFAIGVAFETPMYWVIRHLDSYDWINDSALVVGAPKMLYAVSSVLLLGGLLRAVSGKSYLTALFAMALGLWAIGTVMSL